MGKGLRQNWRLGLRAALASFLVMLAPPVAARIPPPEDTVTYTVRKGDTLYALARQYFLRLSDYQSVQRINQIAHERGIPPGTVIRIPVRLLRSEPLSARVIAFRGEGGTSSAGTITPFAVGSSISPGTVLVTGPGGFMTIELSNGSRITLPSRSRMRIVAMRRFLLDNRLDFDFMLEQGRIETGVMPIPASAGRYRIRTPIAVSAVRGTTFRVGYDSINTPSLTEVLNGTVAVASPGFAAISVPQGYGAGVSASGKIAQEALLPPPTPLHPGKVQIEPQVTLALAPQPDAKSYHIQIARDAGFVDIEAEATSVQPLLSFDTIGNGSWFIRATAIAQSGLEGMPQIYAMRRALTSLVAEATGDANGWQFKWSGSGAGTRIYHFQLRPDRDGALPIVDEPGLRSDTIRLSDLPSGKYLWRIGVRQYADGEASENWLPETGLLVAPAE